MSILGTGIQDGLVLKPITYQWAYDLYQQAVANTWFPNEIQLGQDVSDWKKMSEEERHALTFLMSYFNPNELLVNKALALGVYPYIRAPECHLYLAKQMWEEANHCMSFEYVLETFPIDRDAAYNSHVDIPSMARKEEFEIKYIRRMTEQTLDISTTEGKKDFVRNLVAYNVILEGVWFYSGFMVALSFRQRNLLRNFVALNNQVLDGFTADEQLRIGVHVCPGGDHDSTHSADVDYAGLLPDLFKMNVGRFYLQMASEPDRKQVLRLVSRLLRPHQVVFVGVIDPIKPEVETSAQVRDRVLEAASIVPVNQLGTTDDCGFSPFADDTSTARDIAFSKIRARVEGTALAARELGI